MTDKDAILLLRNLANELEKREALVDIAHKPGQYVDSWVIHAKMPKGVR